MRQVGVGVTFFLSDLNLAGRQGLSLHTHARRADPCSRMSFNRLTIFCRMSIFLIQSHACARDRSLLEYIYIYK